MPVRKKVSDSQLYPPIYALLESIQEKRRSDNVSPAPIRRAKQDFRSPEVRRSKKLGRRFYQRPAVELAPDLLGKILVRQLRGRRAGTYRMRIVETEAYVG